MSSEIPFSCESCFICDHAIVYMTSFQCNIFINEGSPRLCGDICLKFKAGQKVLRHLIDKLNLRDEIMNFIEGDARVKNGIVNLKNVSVDLENQIVKFKKEV